MSIIYKILPYVKIIFRFCIWVLVINVGIHMSIFGWVTQLIPVPIFFGGIFILSIPLAWYLMKNENQEDKWDWK